MLCMNPLQLVQLLLFESSFVFVRQLTTCNGTAISRNCNYNCTGLKAKVLCVPVTLLGIAQGAQGYLQEHGAPSLGMRSGFCWPTGCGAAGGATTWMMTQPVLSCWPLLSPPRCFKPWLRSFAPPTHQQLPYPSAFVPPVLLPSVLVCWRCT